MIRIGKLRDRRVGVVFIEQAEPHRHRREHAEFIHRLAFAIERKRVAFFVRQPERFFDQRPMLLEFLPQSPLTSPWPVASARFASALNATAPSPV